MNIFLLNAFLIVGIVTMIFGSIMLVIYAEKFLEQKIKKQSTDFVINYVQTCEDILYQIITVTYKDIDLEDMLACRKAYRVCEGKFLKIMGEDTPYIIDNVYSDYEEWFKIQVDATLAHR